MLQLCTRLQGLDAPFLALRLCIGAGEEKCDVGTNLIAEGGFSCSESGLRNEFVVLSRGCVSVPVRLALLQRWWLKTCMVLLMDVGGSMGNVGGTYANALQDVDETREIGYTIIQRLHGGLEVV